LSYIFIVKRLKDRVSKLIIKNPKTIFPTIHLAIFILNIRILLMSLTSMTTIFPTPTSNKERVIWKDKDQKTYVVIFATISKEVICHISSIDDSYSALKRLNNLYDTHLELELIQLMVKLFNLKLKNDDPMDLDYEIKSIMHDIDVTGVKTNLPLTAFNKSLYPTYSHYLESLQASGQIKSITFDKLVEKVAEHEKAFGNKSNHSICETMCLAHKGESQPHDSSRGEGHIRGCGRKTFRGREYTQPRQESQSSPYPLQKEWVT
jgi:hypothetical protein